MSQLIRVLRRNGQDIEVLRAGEVAELLGISRQRFYQLIAEHNDFPPPVEQTGRGKLWGRPEVEAWAASWSRRPGRPAKAESQADAAEGRSPQTGRPLRRRT